jgi:hypothetical protein
MIAIIDKLAEYIETWAGDQASPVIIKNWGFVELVTRTSRGTTKNKQGNASVTDQPIPMTITGTHNREQVSLNDQQDFIFWIRTVGRSVLVPNDADSWGLSQGKRKSLPLRIVIAHKVELGEGMVYNLVNDLPPNFYVTGFEFVFLENIDIDPDHETIHNVELGRTNYEKHRFPWNIYAINLNVEFIACTNFQPREFITDEFGNCLFA